jgi:hypothetical protein
MAKAEKAYQARGVGRPFPQCYIDTTGVKMMTQILDLLLTICVNEGKLNF